MATEPSAFGILLRHYRVGAELTQEELAERAQMSARVISDLERGVTQAPRQYTVRQLADALGLSDAERARFTESARVPRERPSSATEPKTGSERTMGIQTFLIADIRGYSAFTAKYGDEAAARFTEIFAEIARAAASAHGGRLIELRGDEVLIAFDSARSALRAALDLQERCAQYMATEPSFPLRVGIGLDAGEAVPVSGGYRGTALNLAARLCSLAGPGEVLASETMVALARRVEGLGYQERGLFTLRGFADPVAVVQVVAQRDATKGGTTLWEGVTDDRVRPQELPIGGFLGALPTNLLVGRNEELRRLLVSLESVAAGSGRLLMLAGEPGAGKTRLAQEVTLDVARRGFLVAAGSCLEPRQTIPYYPFLDVAAALYGVTPAGIRTQIGKRWSDVGQLLPEAGLGIQRRSESQDAQERLFRALTGFVQALSEHRPVAIMLDDLHWADQSSLDLLQHLTRHTRGDAVLLLGTYRDVEVGRQHPLVRALSDLQRHELVDRIQVRRLDQQETTALMSTVLGEASVSDEFASAVYRHTEGNPFFTREVVRALVDQGHAVERDGVWNVRATDQLEVPESIRAVVGQRLSGLVDETQDVLREASVLGQRFRFGDLHMLGDRDEHDVERALEEATIAGMLREERGDAYAFNHALTQQTLYQELSARKRRRLHRAAGGALEARGDGSAGEIAWHYLEAVDPERALPYTLLAGDQAKTVFAYAEAERQYRLAAELADETGDMLRAAEALEKLAGVLEWRVLHDHARASYEAALRLVPEQDRLACARLHRKIALTWAKWRPEDQPTRALEELEIAEHALGDEPTDAPEDWRREWMESQLARAGVYYLLGRASELVEALERALPAVEEWGTLQQQASLFDSLSVAIAQRACYAPSKQTVSYARRAHALWRELGDLEKIPASGFGLGFCLLWSGELDEASFHLQTSLKEATETQDAWVQTRCLIYLAAVHRKRGQVEEVEAYALHAREMAHVADLPGYVAMADAHLAWAALRRGNVTQAREYGQRALENWSLVAAVSAAFHWMVTGPLLGVALTANEEAEAVEHARALLAPTMQPLPTEFAAALEAAIRAWDRGLENTVPLLEEAMARGRAGGYV